MSFSLIGDWNAKEGSQETPGVTGKFGLGVQNEAGQRLIEFCQENALVIANTLFQQHKRRLYPWTSSDVQHRNQTDYILCSQRWRRFIQSAKTRPGADCGSEYELLTAKLRLKLKKVQKTTRSFRYDLNQIPYDYTVEVRNRFKGLDLIDRVPDDLWMEVHDVVQETRNNTFPKKKKCKKVKWLSEEGFLISPCYSLELCIQMGISVRRPQTAILLFCISFSWGWSCSLSPVQCHEPLSTVHQALCLSDLVP